MCVHNLNRRPPKLTTPKISPCRAVEPLIEPHLPLPDAQLLLDGARGGVERLGVAARLGARAEVLDLRMPGGQVGPQVRWRRAGRPRLIPSVAWWQALPQGGTGQDFHRSMGVLLNTAIIIIFMISSPLIHHIVDKQ